MPNLFRDKTAEALCQTIALLRRAVQTAPSGKYPFSSDDLIAALLAQEAAQAGIDAQADAAAAEKAATQAKAAGKASCVSILNAFAARATADATLSDEDLAAIGFAPRRSVHPRPAVAQTPQGLAVEAFADGSLTAKWQRGANPKSAVFVLEASFDGGATWAIVAAGPQVTQRLSGFAPGVAAWLRVSASNAGRASGPSLPASVYAPASAPALRVVSGRAA